MNHHTIIPNVALTDKPISGHSFQTIDCWRGVAALWVVMYHACLGPISNDYPALAQQPLFAFSLHGKLGVILFFILSGYCIANSAWSVGAKQKSILGFAVARVRRIYPAYTISSLLIVGLSVVAYLLTTRGWMQSSWLGAKDFFHRDWPFYVANLAIMQMPMKQDYVNAVSWSLNYEITFYGIIALVLLGVRKLQRDGWLFHVLSGLTIFSLAWLILIPRSCPFPLDLWPMFGLGASLYWAISTHGSRTAVIYLGSIAGLLVIFGFSSCPHPIYANDLSSGSVVAFCAAFVALFFISYRFDVTLARLLVARVLAEVGKFSYSLYLVHVTVLGVVNQIGKKVGVHENSFWILFGAGIIAAVLAGRVFYTWFEAPFMNKRRRKAGGATVADVPPPLLVGATS